MTSLCVKLILRAIINLPGSHGHSIIKNLLALPIIAFVMIINFIIQRLDNRVYWSMSLQKNLDIICQSVMFMNKHISPVRTLFPSTHVICVIFELSSIKLLLYSFANALYIPALIIVIAFIWFSKVILKSLKLQAVLHNSSCALIGVPHYWN